MIKRRYRLEDDLETNKLNLLCVAESTQKYCQNYKPTVDLVSPENESTVKLPPDKVVGNFGNFRECIASGKNKRFSKFFQHWMRLIIIGGSLLMRSLVCQNCSYQKFVQHSNTPSKAKIL